MLVVATRMGYYERARKRPGERFHWPDGVKLANWVQPAEVYEAEQAAAEAAKPVKPKRGQSLRDAAEAMPGPLPSR